MLEELDSPSEWYFDASSQQLYYASNATSGAAPTDPSSAVTMDAVQAEVLVNITGTKATPVKNVTLRGVVLRDTAATFLQQHELPSAGDWGLVHSAAIYAQGTEGLTIRGCEITRVDGQGILLDGYHRNATIAGNDMSVVGSHAIVVWGKTSPCMNANCSKMLPNPAASGPDGREGTQPIGTVVEGNIVSETGIYERHGTMFFTSLAAMSHVKGNIFFNAQRAAVNFQDGFGGGNWLDGNLIANVGRGRNKDEGYINAWARQPYITNLKNGTSSTEPALNVVSGNFILGCGCAGLCCCCTPEYLCFFFWFLILFRFCDNT